MAKAIIIGGVTLISSGEQIRRQDLFRANLITLDDEAHFLAVQALAHCAQHGDTSLMRRLLIDVLGKGKTNGYRVQGLINWMRKHSPMELAGDTINLSGIVPATGEKRRFEVEKAAKTPFWLDKANDEKVAAPVYRDTLLSPITRAIKQFKDAMANTNPDGSAKDPTKPIYVDDSTGSVQRFVESVEVMATALPVDLAKARHKAKLELARIEAMSDSNPDVVAA